MGKSPGSIHHLITLEGSLQAAAADVAFAASVYGSFQWLERVGHTERVVVKNPDVRGREETLHHQGYMFKIVCLRGKAHNLQKWEKVGASYV